MKLYHFPRTRSARVFWAAHELGESLDVHTVNLREGEHKQPPYLEVNPHGWVPALHDEERDVTLFESGAICLHLAENSANADALLPPAGSGARALCYQLTFYANATLDDITIPPYLQIQFRPEEKRDNVMIDLCFKKWGEVVAPYLSGLLGEQDFLCGERFSLADVMVGYDLFFALELDLLEESPNLEVYVERITEREGFQKAFGM